MGIVRAAEALSVGSAAVVTPQLPIVCVALLLGLLAAAIALVSRIALRGRRKSQGHVG